VLIYNLNNQTVLKRGLAKPFDGCLLVIKGMAAKTFISLKEKVQIDTKR
jgi:hypothetical protein